jgi:hypothetical protein
MSVEPKSYREKLESVRSKQATPSPASEPPADNVTVIGNRQPTANTENGNTERAAAVSRRAQRVRLNFIFKNGEEESFPYIHLMPIRFKARDIILVYPWCKITLKGRNMKKLKRRLDLHIHGTIREVDKMADAAEEEATPYAVYEIRREEA